MSDDVVWGRLRDVIRDASGIVVPASSRATALAAITTLARALDYAVEDYVELLSSDRAEVQRVLDTLDFGLTWFMREEQGIRALVTRTLEFVGAGREPSVWCAGCSTGEEPYSLVMTFLELGRRAKVLATDLNSRALAIATTATYPIRKLKQLPAAWQKRFVDWRDDRHFRLSTEVRDSVTFELHNFVEPRLPGPLFDAVSCRNALIYFERDRAAAILRQLSAAVCAGGSLLLGSVERSALWDAETNGADGLIVPLADRSRSAVSRPSRARTIVAAPAPRTIERAPSSARILDIDVEVVLRVARGLERAGRVADALRVVDEALVLAPLAAALQLLRGLLLKNAGQIPAAIDALRSARFLDRTAWLAPYQLGVCLELIGQRQDALEAYRYAMSSVSTGGGSGFPEEVDAMDTLASTIAHACRTRMAELAKD